MEKKIIDVLLLARPDHSLKIYESLNLHKELTFHYMTFRVLNKFWHFLGMHKVSYVDKNVSILKLLTIRHILKYNFHKFVKLNEAHFFEKGVRNLFSMYNPKIIHYWPSYCYREIDLYKRAHPNVITIADQYMPNPIFVLDVMKPIYAKYGLKWLT